MNVNLDVLDETEKLIFSLRSLYSACGYARYRMSKFEEYDLYSRNKDFLVSDSVITFTDTNGRLMALKPDVTLSIIKNNKDRPDELRKLCYNENVYRVAKGSNAFREIMQTGLECFGRVDNGCISEVLVLAARSLAETGRDFKLEISDLEILSDFIGGISAPEQAREQILKCCGEKNLHGILDIAGRYDIPEEEVQPLLALLRLYGNADEVAPRLKELCRGRDTEQEVRRLMDVISVFRGTELENHILIDFSEISDMNYYNGIIFRGYLDRVPDSVLSGGQYDRLMRRMGRKSGAVGFAVYLDKLQGVLE